MEQADFDQVVISESDSHRVTMSKDEYFRLSLRVRVDQLCKGHVRFFHRGQPVSTLKAMKANR